MTAPSTQGKYNVHSKSVTSSSVAPVSEMNVYQTLCKQDERRKFHDTPEELVLVLHKLGFKKVDGGGTHAESLQVSHEGGKERMVCIQLYLACRKACGSSVSVTAGVGVLRHGEKKNIRVQTRGHEAYPGNQ